jgi:hypothetical protein
MEEASRGVDVHSKRARPTRRRKAEDVQIFPSNAHLVIMGMMV